MKLSRAQRRRLLASQPQSFRITCDESDYEYTEELLPADVEGEASTEATGTKLPTFRMNAYNGGPMDLNGFSVPVVVQLSGMRIRSGQLPILRDHDASKVVGHTTAITKTSRNLRLQGTVSGVGQDAVEVVGASKNGFRWQSSIGARVTQLTYVDDRETVTVNGRDFVGPLLVARGTDLREVSFVANGADATTSVRVAATSSGVNDMGFAAWVKAKGFDVENLSDDQEQSLRAMYEAEIAAAEGGDNSETDPSETDPVPINAEDAGGTAVEAGDVVAQLRAESVRIRTLERIAASFSDRVATSDDLLATALEEEWDANRLEERLELQAMRDARSAAPAVHTRNNNSPTSEVIQGALMLRAGVSFDSNHFGTQQAFAIGVPAWLRAGINEDRRQQVMETAHRISGLTLYDLCCHAIRLDGNQVPLGRTEVIQAAFSGGSLTNIFTSNINTVVLASFMEAGDSTGGWTQTEDVNDFKVNERPRMVTGEGLSKHARGKSADHQRRDDTAEAYRIARYSRQFRIDEQDIVDDNFAALSRIPRDMGTAAARLRPDLVYSILFANENMADGTPLFDPAHGNLLTTSPLGDTELRAAVAAMAIQTENGVNLNVPPTHLITPKNEMHQARQLVRSTELRGQSSQDGTRNPLQDDNLTPVSDSRLDNGVVDPDSGTAHAGNNADWYLASGSHPTIEVGYLSGTGRAPSVRTGTLTQGEFGMWADVKLDIGAKALDWRGLLKADAA